MSKYFVCSFQWNETVAQKKKIPLGQSENNCNYTLATPQTSQVKIHSFPFSKTPMITDVLVFFTGFGLKMVVSGRRPRRELKEKTS